MNMKRILKIAAVAFVIVLGSSWRNTVAAQDYPDPDDQVDYQTFYDDLSPHGRWMQYPDYGYVWIPNAGPDFRPYSTNGHWVWTDDYEWMWVSDYDWGWAPFHYGRWGFDSNYGWYWVPGYEWSPAWVAWRDGGEYYGWAPLRPGINISINFNIGGYSPPYDYWNFAPRRYITSPRIYDYCYDRRQNVTIINQTTIINNYNYSRNVFRTGPRRADVEIYTGRINPVRFRAGSSAGRSSFRNNEVTMYRPNVRRDNARVAPRTFERFDRNNNNNDNRIGRNDNGRFNRDNNFRRDDNNPRANDNNNRTNNLPRREVSNDPRPQDNNNNGPGGRGRVIDRNNNSGQPGNSNDNRRIERRNNPFERNNNNNPQPQNNTNDNRRSERRVFERNNNDNNNNTPNRQPSTEQRRSFPQMERRESRQPQSQPQPQQQQQRTFERRDNGGQNNGNNNSGGGGRSGRRRG